jgi:hypothetical protein
MQVLQQPQFQNVAATGASVPLPVMGQAYGSPVTVRPMSML